MDKTDGSQRVRQVIDRIDKMPSLPSVAARILEVVQNSKSAASDLADVMSRDQGCTAKVLKLVNSAYYSFPYKISSVSHAVALLGFDTIRSLALGLSIFALLQQKNDGQPLDRERLWEHSIGCAIWSGLIAGKVQQVNPEEAFVAGLLHDIGKVLFNEYFKRKMAEAVRMSEAKGIPLIEAETRAFGVDHAEAGAIWAERWNLPPLIRRAVAYHHEPLGLAKTEDATIRKIVAIVHIADQMTEAAGIGTAGDVPLPVLSPRILDLLQLTDDSCWGLASQVKDEVQKAREFFNLVEEGKPAGSGKPEKAAYSADRYEPVLERVSTLAGWGVDRERLLENILSESSAALNGIAALFTPFGGDPPRRVASGDVPASVDSVARQIFARGGNLSGDEAAGPWFPLREGDRLMGVLWVSTKDPLTARERAFVQEVGRELLKVIQKMEESEQSRWRARVLGQLLEDSAAMTLLAGLEDLYPTLVGLGRELARADAVTLWLIQGDMIASVAADGFPVAKLPRLSQLPEESWAGWVLASREPLLVEGLKNIRAGTERELFRWLGYEGHLLLPLDAAGKMLGLLALHSREPHRWTGSEVALLSTFAAQAAVAIDNALLHQDILSQVEELRRTQAQLVHSTKLAALGELSATIAHEVNNPLTSVLGYTGLLLNSTPPEDPRYETMKVIESEALRTRKIVRELLDYARQQEPSAQSVDLNETLRSVLSFTGHRLVMSNVEVHEHYTEGLPRIVLDPHQMKQVFVNLINNALDAMPEGGALTVSTFFVPKPDGDWVEAAVQDTGVGISPEHRRRIFEPFFTTKGEGSGTGLGLSVSLNIVRSHGGEILVESAPGKGSVFRVRLPVAPVAEPAGQALG
jgi:putative nucleotidyltransferase with HDIG domain